MNKYDLNIVFILLIVLIILYIMFNKNEDVNKAYIYYSNNLIKKVDLNKDSIFNIDGYNGNIKIQVKNKKIRVIEEKSKRHLCSRQGYIENSYESIICLPNKIVITLSNNELDGVVK